MNWAITALSDVRKQVLWLTLNSKRRVILVVLTMLSADSSKIQRMGKIFSNCLAFGILKCSSKIWQLVRRNYFSMQKVHARHILQYDHLKSKRKESRKIYG